MKIQLTFVSLWCLFLLLSVKSEAIIGVTGIHDPSTIINDNGRYHVFGTGNQVYHLYSDDLIKWYSGSTVFARGTWPDWIKSYVPDFGGTFWAPDGIYMNGYYYVYYSCSTFGSSRSAIGVARTVSINNPKWEDLGVVVSSNGSSTAINAIDPGLCRDDKGNVYMTYGSWFGGIGMVELDTISGKPLSSTKKLYGGNHQSIEASTMFYRDGYYYLVVNHGNCCQGVNSTYYITVGRSATPDGTYSGWRTILSTSGKYIGPGHFGLYQENDHWFVTYHYYDGDTNGTPRLNVVGLEFDLTGWPVIKQKSVESGTYRVANASTKLVWETEGCTGIAGQAIIQNTNDENAKCQVWDIVNVANDDYIIRSAFDIGEKQVIYIPKCNPANKLETYAYLNNNCQKYRIERHVNGSLVFSSALSTNKAISIPQNPTQPGEQLQVLNYTGAVASQWTVTAAEPVVTQNHELFIDNNNDLFQLYPNPSSNGVFTIQFNSTLPEDCRWLEIRSFEGKTVFSDELGDDDFIQVETNLPQGMYLLSVTDSNGKTVKRIIITK